MLVIEKNNVKGFVRWLAKKRTVIVPVRRSVKGAVESVFEEFDSETEIDFEYLPTLRSIKEYFLPAQEDIFTLNKKRKISTPKTEDMIIFGLNHGDMEALGQLDEIMSKPQEDFFYLRRRSAAIIIGLVNEPLKVFPKADLVLVKNNDNQYKALSFSKKGNQLVKNKFFKNISSVAENNSSVKIETKDIVMPRLKTLLADPELIADAIKWSWQSNQPIWDELAGRCLGCGICAYVCPLCYCFSIEDSISLDNEKCNRCRKWDACTLPYFSQISGGHNFHKTIKERYYNWYYHKFVRAYKEYGKAQCVACGRCQKYCPAKIDIEEYLIRIIDSYQQSKVT